MRHICLTGWNGCGKSVLLSLFDGHSESFVVATHEKAAFSLAKFKETYNLKDTRPIRSLLSKSKYYNHELISNDNGIDFFISNKVEDVIKVPIKFDFYSFEREWVSRLLKMKKWSPTIVFDCIYSQYCQSVFGQEKNTVVYLGEKNISEYKPYIHSFPTAKVLIVTRSISGIYATLSKRKLTYENKKQEESKNKILIFIKAFLLSFKISCYEKMAKELTVLYPDNFRVVSFESILSNTEIVMQNLAAWVEMSFEKCLLYPTMHGHNLEINGKSYLGTDNDKETYKLKKAEKVAIKLGYMFGNIFFSIKTFFKSIR